MPPPQGSDAPKRSGAGAAQRARSFGRVRSAASLPPPYQIVPPVLLTCCGRPTAYPVTSPGLTVLYRLRTSTPASAEPGEELILGARPARRSAHLAAQRRAGRLGPPAPGRLLRLGADRPPGGGTLRWCGTPQPEPALGRVACLAHPVEVIPDLRAVTVLAGQRGDNVNVVRSVPDRHPAHPEIVAVRREAPVHDPRGNPRPFRVGQHPVIRRRPDRAMPHRLAVRIALESRQRLREQPS